mmetsp:Transcript_35967/g.78474  ORF Transcript_35967/g.78474 Transcript_35967/m.78474 type:complete len:231 (+) Transcript_35967:132-824(+)
MGVIMTQLSAAGEPLHSTLSLSLLNHLPYKMGVPQSSSQSEIQQVIHPECTAISWSLVYFFFFPFFSFFLPLPSSFFPDVCCLCALHDLWMTTAASRCFFSLSAFLSFSSLAFSMVSRASFACSCSSPNSRSHLARFSLSSSYFLFSSWYAVSLVNISSSNCLSNSSTSVVFLFLFDRSINSSSRFSLTTVSRSSFSFSTSALRNVSRSVKEARSNSIVCFDRSARSVAC